MFIHSLIGDQKSREKLLESKKDDVTEAFLYKLKSKIIRDKEALNELLKDIETLSEEKGLEYPVICHSFPLKRSLIQEFGDKISFFPSGKYLIVHSADFSPCEHAVAALHRRGLRDEDLLKSFGRMIRRKLKQMKCQEKKWPLTPEELIKQLEKGP